MRDVSANICLVSNLVKGSCVKHCKKFNFTVDIMKKYCKFSVVKFLLLRGKTNSYSHIWHHIWIFHQIIWEFSSFENMVNSESLKWNACMLKKHFVSISFWSDQRLLNVGSQEFQEMHSSHWVLITLSWVLNFT